MRSPLVSVIIPAYNAECTIEETLHSVFRQTYPHIEIIVVDDGSTDGTVTLVESYAESYENLKLIRQQNAGVAAARNAGIHASRGEYIAPLDADDLWHPQKLALHVAALEEAGPAAAVAYSPFRVVNEYGVVVDKSRKYTHCGDVFNLQLEDNFIGNGSGMTVRKKALLETGGYSTILHEQGLQGGEDYLLQMLLARYYHYVSVPLYLIGYRVCQGNMSSNNLNMIKSMFAVYDSLRERFELDTAVLHKGRTRLLKYYVGCACGKRNRLTNLMQIVSYGRQREETSFFINVIIRVLIFKTGGKCSKLCKKLLLFLAPNKNRLLDIADFHKMPPQE